MRFVYLNVRFVADEFSFSFEPLRIHRRVANLEIRLHRSVLAQQEPKRRHLGKSRKIHLRAVFVARLMIAMLDVIFGLGLAPGFVVSFEFQPFVDRERRNAHARQTEMIGAVIMPSFRMRIGPNRQAELFAKRFRPQDKTWCAPRR